MKYFLEELRKERIEIGFCSLKARERRWPSQAIDQHKRLQSESFVTIKSKNEKADEVSSGAIFKVQKENHWLGHFRLLRTRL
jgi:hypothetical protein